MLTLAFRAGVCPASSWAGREVSVWRGDSGEVWARSFASERHFWITWPAVGVFAFSRRSDVVDVWPSQGVLPESIPDTFHRAILPVALQAKGYQTLHASAVTDGSGMVLFCGVRGAGKSTLAYGIRDGGFRQCADDAVVLDIQDVSIRAHVLPFAPRLRPPAAAHFRDGAPATHLPSERASTSIPLLAIFLLTQSGASLEPVVERVAPERAFAALLPHAYCFDPTDVEDTRRLVDDYAQVADRVPVMCLSYAPDFQRFSRVVDRVLATVDALRSSAPHAPVPQ
jgi:hypothetical protein